MPSNLTSLTVTMDLQTADGVRSFATRSLPASGGLLVAERLVQTKAFAAGDGDGPWIRDEQRKIYPGDPTWAQRDIELMMSKVTTAAVPFWMFFAERPDVIVDATDICSVVLSITPRSLAGFIGAVTWHASEAGLPYKTGFFDSRLNYNGHRGFEYRMRPREARIIREFFAARAEGRPTRPEAELDSLDQEVSALEEERVPELGTASVVEEELEEPEETVDEEAEATGTQLTTQQVAHQLGLSEDTIRHWLKDGTLRSIWLSNRAGYRIPHTDVQRILAERREQHV
jgi:excisionase family DNA binding protein